MWRGLLENLIHIVSEVTKEILCDYKNLNLK